MDDVVKSLLERQPPKPPKKPIAKPAAEPTLKRPDA